MSSQDKLYELFENGTLAGKHLGDVCKYLQIPYREKNRLADLLNKLVEQGKLYQTQDGRFGTIAQLGLIKGVLSGNERGFAFLVPEDKESYPEDFFIPHRNLHGALHGDTVLIERCFGRSDDEGNVVKILARGYDKIVGIFRRDKRAGYLIPDEKKYFSEINKKFIAYMV